MHAHARWKHGVARAAGLAWEWDEIKNKKKKRRRKNSPCKGPRPPASSFFTAATPHTLLRTHTEHTIFARNVDLLT